LIEMVKRKHLTITGLIVVASVSTVLATAAITSYAYQGRILPRTTVAGVKLSNQTLTEAYPKITNQINKIEETPLPISFNGNQAQPKLKDLGVAVSVQSTVDQVKPKPTIWEWLTPYYWKEFFINKNVSLDASVDRNRIQTATETLLKITTTAKDAQIKTDNGQLTVVPAQAGYSVNIDPVVGAVQHLITAGEVVSAELSSAETPAAITTEIANQTKTEIDQSLKPVYLQVSGQKVTVPINDQYSFITFSTTDEKLTWQISQAKIGTYVSGKVAKKYDIKMVPKQIKFETNEVLQEGKDGQTVDVGKLASDIYRTITEKTDTTNQPIAVNFKSIPLTQQVIYPDYVLNLFPGRYIDINLAKQELFLIEGNNLLYTFRISSGIWYLPTPKGTFSIASKSPRAYSAKYGLYMPNWNNFTGTSDDGRSLPAGDYGIHALPEWPGGQKEGENHIGTPVSHGCVRLNDENAAIVYGWADIGTPVHIH
jgi:lipoprotein-anchoring transpeptidase ErfK/SrfK